VRDFDMQAPNCSAADCWHSVAELLHMRTVLLMFAIVHRPPEATSGQGAVSAPAASSESHAYVFQYQEVQVTLKLAALNALNIAVDVQQQTASGGNANTEQAGKAQPAWQHLQSLTLSCPLEHRLQAQGDAAQGLSGTTGAHAPPVWSALEVFAGLHIVAEPQLPSDLTALFYPSQLAAAQPQLMLDGLAYTTVGHNALMSAVAPSAIAQASLQRVPQAALKHTAPPYRALLRMAGQLHSVASAAARYVEFACGVELRACGIALLHFDLRSQQGDLLLHNERSAPPGQAKSLAMPREVPQYSAFMQTLLSGKAPLAWRVQDAGAVVPAEAEGGGTVVVWQRDLGQVVHEVLRYLDTQLSV
jgi:hypothetical protein